MNTGRPERLTASGVGALVLISAGPLIWVAQFAVAYAVTTFACAVLLAPWWADFAVAAATTAAAAMLAVHLLLAARIAPLLGVPTETAVKTGLVRTARLATLIAMVAVLWTGSSIVFVAACTQGR
ncbi:hypothetical protein [Microbaculum marinum]|uniref:Uncharacterized protein n=1 Tax=Microbaculum marinum TaxID=1764581 RepID=A0AAW9RKZ3_9HYPH